jgi:transcriptional regulator with GAF, ATPase, and Fis domain
MAYEDETIRKLIESFISHVASSVDIALALSDMLEGLRLYLGADLGLLWMSVSDELTVIQESPSSANSIGNTLDSVESGRIVIGLMPMLKEPGAEKNRVVQIHNSESAIHEWSKWSPLKRFCDGYTSTIITGLTARGIFSGFLSFQTAEKHHWTVDNESALLAAADIISLIVSYERQIQLLSDELAQQAQRTEN